MKNYVKMAAFCLLAALTVFPSLAEDAASPAGEWLVKDKTAHIHVAMCGAKLWGVISWVKTPGTDEHNPDISKRNRSVVGLPILLGLEPEDSEWSGRIYNADNGKIYNGNVKLTSPDTLHVKGCVLKILCGGEDWTRLESSVAEKTPDAVCKQLN